MKKNVWILGVAVAALTSCTQSEVLEVAESRVIQFDTFVGKSTRAAIPINQHQDNNQYEGNTPPKSNLWQFWVFGTENGTSKFNGTDNNAKVYFNKINNTFMYDNHLSWVFGKTYNFAAYSNGNTPLVTLNGDPYNTPVTSPPAKVIFTDLKTEGVIYGSKLFFDDYIIGDYDLLAAITQTTNLPSAATSVSPVPLTFQHMLALVNIRLENNTEDLHMQIANMEFSAITKDDCAYMINAANTDVTKSTRTIVWDNMDNDNANDADSETGNYIFKGTAQGILASENPADYLAPGQAIELTYFVIPQNNQGLNNITLTTQSYHRSENTVGGNTTYSYTLSNNNGLQKDHTISLAVPNEGHTSWQPGYRYSYTGSLSGNAHFIHFTVQGVTDWSANNLEVDGSVVTQ